MSNKEFITFLRDICRTNSLNRLPDTFGGGRIFSNPIIGVASSDDRIFDKFKEVVGPEHLTPLEFWIKHGFTDSKSIESKLRIISIVFPYSILIKEESLSKTEIPADIYSIGRNYANEFINDVLTKCIEYFKNLEHRAMIPILSPAYNHLAGPFYANWSDRHIAFAAGNGTFSLHEALITELGCNVRFGSFITDYPLEITPRRYEEPYQNCLFYSKGACKKCIERCPAGAITEEGHDKVKCFIYGQKINRIMNKRHKDILKPTMRYINGKWEKHKPAVGCAFCQFNVPCMDKNPTRKIEKNPK